MSVLKLSQIVPSAPSGASDQIVGVIGGAIDALYSIEQILDTFGGVQGDILFRGPSSWSALAPGTSGFVLTTHGAAANPTWAAASSSLVVNTTPITGGVSGDIVFDNAGTFGEATLSSLIDTALGSTQGDILYRSGSAWTVLAPSTSGFLLQTNGAGANPSWVTPPSAGSITVGVTTIAGGTDTHVVYQAAVGLFGEAANFTIVSGNPNVMAGNQYSYNSNPVIQADTANKNYWFGGAGNLTATGQHNLGDAPAALVSVTTGSDNSAYGVGALTTLTSGQQNMAIGTSAMGGATTASGNLAIGVNALGGATTFSGSSCVALGNNAMQFSTTAVNDMAIGTQALQNTTSGQANVGVGQRAMTANTTGSFNVAIGASSLTTATADNDNVAVGYFSLISNNGGGNNVAIGWNASGNSSTVSSSIVIGWNSGSGLTSGTNNTIISYSEGTITTGSNNIAIGFTVGVPSGTASNQLVIGNYIYGTGLSGTGSSISPGAIGIGVKAPAHALDVNGGIQGNDVTALIYAATAMNNGAGTGSGVTFTNAPGSSVSTGNPTKWIPINDAGTIRYVPAF